MELVCDNQKIREVYDRLRIDNFSDAKIDIDHDGKLLCEEITDVLFDNYKEYGALIKGISGYEPTWIIHDKKIVEKINKAKKNISIILNRKGFKQNTIDFDKRLAIGLFYLAYAPTKEEFAKGYENNPLCQNIYIELKDEGLQEFAAWLETNGGFGLGTINEDSEFEIPADEVIKKHEGYCTKMSKVLFATFTIGGFEPFFAHLSAEEVDELWNEYWHGKVPREKAISKLQRAGHVFIGLKFGDEVRYFDPMIEGAIAATDAPFQGARHLTLREFRILESANKLADAGQMAEFTKESERQKIPLKQEFVELFEQVKEETNNLFDATLTLGSAASEVSCALYINMLGKVKSFGGSIEDVKAILEMGRPICSEDVVFLCSAAVVMGQSSEAQLYLTSALKLNPNDVPSNVLMGRYFENIFHDIDKAKTYYEIAYGLDETRIDVLYKLGQIYLKEKAYAKAEECFRKVLKKNPLNPLVIKDLANTLVQQNRSDEAVKLYLGKIALLDDSVDNYASLSTLYSNLKVQKQAALMKEMAWQYQSSRDDKNNLLIHYGNFLAEQGE
jgi:tetratricopeptide (TPR) repeat protein